MNLVISEELPRTSRAAFSLVITKANNTNNVGLLGKLYVKARITYGVKGKKSERGMGGWEEGKELKDTDVALRDIGVPVGSIRDR